MSKELKPCPFCGYKQARLHDTLPMGNLFYVECEYCHADGGTADTREVAVKMWNKRTADWTRFTTVSGNGTITFTCETPEDDEDILVCDSHGRIWSDIFHDNGVECYLESGTEFTGGIYWKPLDESELPEGVTP